jgi:hypothetical protein
VVLDNRDLLADILLRISSPTWLVRAALTCKSWLRVASDPDFLDRFRALHPPRVLGLGLLGIHSSPRLLRVPQPPDLATAACRAGRAIENLGRLGKCTDYCNGRLLVETRYRLRYAVTSLLHEAPAKILPPPPPLGGGAAEGPGLFYGHRLFLLEDDGDDSTSCLCLSMACDKETVRVDFSILRSGVWGVPQSAVEEVEQEPYFTVLGHKLISGGKVYMLTTVGCILALDLATATLSAFNLPDGVEHCASLKFSRSKQSGLYLICATGFQLHIWHGDGAGHWVLVDTVSVYEACAGLNVQTWVPNDGNTSPVFIVGVGDNAEFVILELVASRIICCMQLGNRAVEKIAQGKPPNYGPFARPITMVWPPFRPVLPAHE